MLTHTECSHCSKVYSVELLTPKKTTRLLYNWLAWTSGACYLQGHVQDCGIRVVKTQEAP